MPWDPSIILSAKQYTGPDPLETMRTLSQLALAKTQQQGADASLADMLHQRQRRAAIEGVYQQNATTPEMLPAALMRIGAGPEAFAAQDQGAQMQKQLSDLLQAHRKHVGELLYGTKDQADYERRLSAVPPDQRAMYPATWAEAKPLVEAVAIPPEKRADLEQKGTEFEETKRHNREMEKRPSGFPAMSIVTGEGGAQYLVNTRDAAAPAKPVKDEQGNPIAKPQAADTKLAERNVGGFTFDMKNPPTAEGAKKMASVAIAKDKILGSLGRLEKLFDDNGTELFGETASQMEGEWKEVTDQMRVMNEMGVPNGSDYVMLAKQIPNPVGAAGATQSNKSIKAKFGTLKTQIAQTLAATAKAYKYAPEGSGGSATDHSHDAALEWLKANPNSPKAAAVAAKLKAAGVLP